MQDNLYITKKKQSPKSKKDIPIDPILNDDLYSKSTVIENLQEVKP